MMMLMMTMLMLLVVIMVVVIIVEMMVVMSYLCGISVFALWGSQAIYNGRFPASRASQHTYR